MMPATPSWGAPEVVLQRKPPPSIGISLTPQQPALTPIFSPFMQARVRGLLASTQLKPCLCCFGSEFPGGKAEQRKNDAWLHRALAPNLPWFEAMCLKNILAQSSLLSPLFALESRGSPGPLALPCAKRSVPPAGREQGTVAKVMTEHTQEETESRVQSHLTSSGVISPSRKEGWHLGAGEVAVSPQLRGGLPGLDPGPPCLVLLSCRQKGSTHRQGDSDPLQLALWWARRKGTLQGQSWYLGGQMGQENGGRHCRVNGEVVSASERELERKSQMERLQTLTSEAASVGGLPQKRLLRAMPACSMFPVFPNTRTRGQGHLCQKGPGEVRRARGEASQFDSWPIWTAS
ncbi:hypothetical protein Cadr_000000511 [Camelus dromedarius]|uniref:Uncharacterized protein n=1 Tax=Camelus dromedarius TaxID=9838 RepID=A0A5N4EKP8_CAMDR|nr:hypothetical protein Cadr_000000511 [Camelus dromedarius]